MSDVYNLGLFLCLKFWVHNNRQTGRDSRVSCCCTWIFFYGATAPSGPEPSHFRGFTITGTLHSVGLLWTSDQLVAETSAWDTHHSQQTNFHAPGEIRTRNPSQQVVTDPRLRPRGHWDRLWRACALIYIYIYIYIYMCVCVCVCVERERGEREWRIAINIKLGCVAI
jgi:hypothetical protein